MTGIVAIDCYGLLDVSTEVQPDEEAYVSACLMRRVALGGRESLEAGCVCQRGIEQAVNTVCDTWSSGPSQLPVRPVSLPLHIMSRYDHFHLSQNMTATLWSISAYQTPLLTTV